MTRRIQKTGERQTTERVVESTETNPVDNTAIKEAADTTIETIDGVLAENEAKMAELDALLNEVELVLEINAAEFVKNYQQRGGQ